MPRDVDGIGCPSSSKSNELFEVDAPLFFPDVRLHLLIGVSSSELGLDTLRRSDADFGGGGLPLRSSFPDLPLRPPLGLPFMVSRTSFRTSSSSEVPGKSSSGSSGSRRGDGLGVVMYSGLLPGVRGVLHGLL